jgi:hypothetical protein
VGGRALLREVLNFLFPRSELVSNNSSKKKIKMLFNSVQVSSFIKVFGNRKGPETGKHQKNVQHKNTLKRNRLRKN